MSEVDRLAPLTADLEQEVVQLARYEAWVQQRDLIALVEDALQRARCSMPVIRIFDCTTRSRPVPTFWTR